MTVAADKAARARAEAKRLHDASLTKKTVLAPGQNKSPIVSAAFDAATKINYACGEITSAASQHVIVHATIDALVAKIRGETANLLGAVAQAGGPAVPV